MRSCAEEGRPRCACLPPPLPSPPPRPAAAQTITLAPEEAVTLRADGKGGLAVAERGRAEWTPFDLAVARNFLRGLYDRGSARTASAPRSPACPTARHRPGPGAAAFPADRRPAGRIAARERLRPGARLSRPHHRRRPDPPRPTSAWCCPTIAAANIGPTRSSGSTCRISSWSLWRGAPADLRMTQGREENLEFFLCSD